VLGVICWKTAINLAYFRGNTAFPLMFHEDVEVHSQRQSFKLPSVLILLDNKDKYPHSNILPLTRQNVMIRDNFTCQYCGRKLTSVNGTIDHVFPLAKGGTNTWRNVVACCEPCNNEKDDLKAAEFEKQTGKKLMRKPITPHRGILYRHHAEKPEYAQWKPYIA